MSPLDYSEQGGGRGGRVPWRKKRNATISEIQGFESNPVAELCQAIQDQNFLHVNQPSLICSHAVAAAKEIPAVRKQLRVKLKLGDSNKLELGLVDSGPGAI